MLAHLTASDSTSRLSAASGLVWGLIACFIGHRPFGYRVWGGLIVAPLIGLLIGRMSRRLSTQPRIFQVLASLFQLYLAGSCFAVAMGLTALVVEERPAAPYATLLQHFLVVLWGLTFGGYVLVLWPLSYVNHRLVWRAAD